MNQKKTEPFNLQRILGRLLSRFPFFGTVMAELNYAGSDAVKDISTDGKTVVYNPDFMEALHPDLRLYYIMRQVSHAAFRHQDRGRGKHAGLWQEATEAVVNAWLHEEGLAIPEDAVCDLEARNYPAEAYYEKLAAQIPIPLKADDDKAEESFEGFPDWDQNTGQEALSAFPMREPVSGKELLKDILPEYMEAGGNTSYNSEPEAFESNQELVEDDIRDLIDSLTHTAAGAGDSSRAEQVDIIRAKPRKPLIDWRRILRDTVFPELDWSDCNAVIEDGIIRSGLEEMTILDTEILLDTSGSIEEAFLRTFLEECRWILSFSRVRIGCFDTEFYGFHEIHTLKDLKEFPVTGRGGTDFAVAAAAFSRRIDNRIIFTDGDGDIPDQLLPITWIIFGEKEIHPKNGRVIYVTGENLKREGRGYQI